MSSTTRRNFSPSEGLVIPRAVVAISRVASAQEDPVGAPRESRKDELGVHAPGAHRPEEPDARGITGAGDAGRIPGDVRAPVAPERDDPRLGMPRLRPPDGP